MKLTLGKPTKKVPGGDAVVILRDGVATEFRPIVHEESDTSEITITIKVKDEYQPCPKRWRLRK